MLSPSYLSVVLWIVYLARCTGEITEKESKPNQSIMKLPPWPAPKVSLRLIFFDDFNFFDNTKWSLAATMSQSKGPAGQFEMYSPELKNCYVRDSQMFLRPTLTADTFGEDFLYHGVLNITEKWGYCNPTWGNGCFKNASAEGIMPPVMSCYMTSKFYFRYGRVEIVAQMPRGDWMWPALWLMPQFAKFGGWPRSGEIDIAELAANRNYGNIGIQRTTASLHFGDDRSGDHHRTNQHWASNGTYADGFHKWAVDWTPSYLNLYIDDYPILATATPPEGFHDHFNVSGPNIWGNSTNAPFDQAFFFIISVSVGGIGGNFPDKVPNYPYPKPWSQNDTTRVAMDKFWKARDGWYSTWHGEDAAMKIQSVSVWGY